MLFENDDSMFRLSIRGTSFLAACRGRVYAVTAKHNVNDFAANQYRIPACFGSNYMLPFEQPFTAQLHHEDFEDFVIVPIRESATPIEDFDPSCASPVETTGINWPAVKTVRIAGFPTELNDLNYEIGRIEYQPVLLAAEVLAAPNSDGIGTVKVFDIGTLKSFDGLSGSPVYDGKRLIGIVLRGSQDTAVSQVIHFLDSRVLDGLIEHHLKNIGNDAKADSE